MGARERGLESRPRGHFSGRPWVLGEERRTDSPSESPDLMPISRALVNFEAGARKDSKGLDTQPLRGLPALDGTLPTTLSTGTGDNLREVRRKEMRPARGWARSPGFTGRREETEPGEEIVGARRG